MPTPGMSHDTDPERPLDAALATLIDHARHRDRGFALDVAKDLGEDGRGSTTFRIEQVLPPIDEYEPPTAYRFHILEDVDSVIAFARRYGTKERSLILVTNGTVVLVLDETPERGEREKAVMPWEFSEDLAAWQGVLCGKAIEHRKLMDFLILHQHNLRDVAVLDLMRCVRASMNVKLDSDIRLERETAGVIFESSAGPELLKFPRAFDVGLPVFELDVTDEAAWVTLGVRVEVVLPREPKQPIGFILVAPGLKAALRGRVDAEIARLRSALDGWTIVRGVHDQRPRTLGRERRK